MTVLDEVGWASVPERAAGPAVVRPDAAARPPAIPLRAVLVIADVLAVTVAWLLLRATLLADASIEAWAAGAGAAIAAALAGLVATGLYRSRVSSIRAIELARIPRVACVSAAVATVALHQVEATGFSWLTVAVASVSGAATLVLARGAFDANLRHCRSRGRFCRSLLVVGGGAEAAKVNQLLGQHPELGYRLAGRVGVQADGDVSGLPLLGTVDEVLEVAEATGANGVLITAASMSEADRSPLIVHLLAHGLHVHLSAGLRGLDPRRLTVVPLAHEPFFYVEGTSLQPYQLRVKRALDLVGASIALLVFSPVLLVAAALVKLTDRGPVLFRQERVGRYGKNFTCFKLRTMVVGADEIRDTLDNARSGPLFKAVDDPRVTRIGRFLRYSSIDELPQLLNVLRGEMSLVGPRPALPAEVAQFDPELLRRLEVPPGITGLWQVEARDVSAFDAYRRLDLYYVENWRFSLDLVVLVLTVQVVVSRLLRRRPAADTVAVAPSLAGDPIILD